MERICGIFQDYNEFHPLWFVSSYFSNTYEFYIIDEFDEEKINEISPSLIITDYIIIPDTNDIPYLLYLSENQFYQFINSSGNTKSEIIKNIEKAKDIFCCSGKISVRFNNLFGIQTKIQYPYIEKPRFNQLKYIFYDPEMGLVSQIQGKLSREEFRPLNSIKDLANAKLYLCDPSPEKLFDMKICWATCYEVPIIHSEHDTLSEFLTNSGMPIKNNNIVFWEQAIKSSLRNRPHLVKRLLPLINKYKQMTELDNRIKQSLRSKPTRADFIKKLPFVTIQEPPNNLKQQIANQRTRKIQQHPITEQLTLPPYEIIFLSGGIGDIIALESFFSDDQRQKLKTICYGTNKQIIAQKLFESLPNYSSLKNHLIVWNDFSSFWCFLHKHECIQKLSTIPPELQEAEDFGIVPKFPEINGGRLIYNGSSFLKHKICDISNFCTPPNYVCICPYSTDKRGGGRDFDDQDWAATLYYLIKNKIMGVILNTGNDYIPDNSAIVNLSNKTTINQAIEILKKSRGYIGIDSCISVLATKIFDYPDLMIKSKNQHLYSNKHIYYAPKKNFNFLNNNITKMTNF